MSTKFALNKASFLLAALVFAGAASAKDVPAAPDVENCKASYPRAAIADEEEGKVSVSLLVSSAGDVKETRIDKSSGFRTLDKAAIKKLTNCKFTPGTKNGSPADTWAKVDYAWKLD